MNDRSLADYRRAARAVIAAHPIERLRLQVISDSMWPLLCTGDAVIVQPIDPDAGRGDCRVGDVLVAQRGAELITHRLIAIDGEQWITRGDNAILVDAPVMRADCVGRVEAIERGTYQIDLTQPQWAQLNQRLGQIGRVHWRINRWLRLAPALSPLAIRLAWLIALPFRALAHMLVMRVQAV
ncbi:MAG TPA: S24/S26 family peptidase [Anaerolineae bacterium]|nr:S24/S26 family peptidase [Anaerolineae bacterium]